jgi:hypothetical protein
MDNADLISQLTIVKMEISVCRKGSTAVRIDLRNRLLSWRESNRWNRNFTRSINLHERETVIRGIHECHILSWRPDYGAITSEAAPDQFNYAWRLSLYTDDIEPVFFSRGQDAYPPEFSQWIDVISRICRQPFQVLD